VVERMNAELGMNVRTRRRTGHWDDVEHLCAELREFMQLPGRGEEEMEGELHDCFLPTHKYAAPLIMACQTICKGMDLCTFRMAASTY
jgi:hypothetical protein